MVKKKKENYCFVMILGMILYMIVVGLQLLIGRFRAWLAERRYGALPCTCCANDEPGLPGVLALEMV